MRAVGRAGFVAGTVAALVAAGGTASAGEPVNDTGSAVLVDASYTRDGVTGYVSAWQQQQRPARLFLFEQSGGWIDCLSGAAAEPGDEGSAYVGTFTYGEGTASVTTGPRYGTGSAKGSVEAYRETIDGCTETNVVTGIGTVPVAVDLVANGELTTTRNRADYHVPSELNEHYSLTFTSRSAAGTAEVAGLTARADGLVGKSAWTYHAN